MDSNPKPSSASSLFSSFKVFNFRSSTSPEEDDRPPPLPPKDSYYLYNNRSATNLLMFARSRVASTSSPAPSRSTLTLTSVNSDKDRDPPSASASLAKSFFRFAKRGARSPRTLDSKQTDQPVEDAPDKDISLPWNFQHNIHVDEGFGGLPPSWSTSLMEAGFSTEDIDNIRSRRIKLPTHPIYSQPTSPSNLSPSPFVHPPTSGVLSRPSPRTSSLRGHGSPGSSSSSHASHTSAPTRSAPPPRVAPIITATATTTAPTSTLSQSLSSLPLPNIGPLHRPQASGASLSSLDMSRTHSYADSSADMRSRLAHVSHASSTLTPLLIPGAPQGAMALHPVAPLRLASAVSPAVATEESRMAMTAPTTQQPFVFPPKVALPATPSPSTGALQTSSSMSSNAEPTDAAATQQPPRPISPARPGLGNMPPRLSFHDGIWEGWAEQLMSALPSVASETGSASGDSKRTFAEEQERLLAEGQAAAGEGPASPTVSLQAEAAGNNKTGDAESPLPTSPIAKNPPPPRWVQLQKPLPSPLPQVPEVEKEQEVAGSPEGERVEVPSPEGVETDLTSPLWDEVMGMVAEDQPKETLDADDLQDVPVARQDRPAVEEPERPVRPPPPTRKPPPTPIVVQKETDEAYDGVSVVRSPGFDGAGPLSPGFDSAGLLSPPALRSEERATSNSNRDSGASTLSMTSETTVTHAVVSSVRAFGTRAVAEKVRVGGEEDGDAQQQLLQLQRLRLQQTGEAKVKQPDGCGGSSESGATPPLSARFSSGSSGSGSGSPSSSLVHERETPLTDLEAYPEEEGIFETGKTTLDDARVAHDADKPVRPSIIIHPTSPLEPPPSTALSPPSVTSSTSPATPSARYTGWVSRLVAPLKEYIDESVDPREHYLDLTEIAEGESGSVFAARIVGAEKLKLSPTAAVGNAVAIKNVPLVPSGSPKLLELKRELDVLRGLRHDNVLTIDQLYVDVVEDSLWIRMELMEKSLADVLSMVEAGLMLQERIIARFASDVLRGLDYLQSHRVAHRDVRSDNLLINSAGVLKISDFSSAVRLPPESPMCDEPAGVIYWQAPEVRSGPYDALKIDVWSMGATVWEMAETQPPFADADVQGRITDHWPPLQQPELYSRSFHEFLRTCSHPASSRPNPSDLLTNLFIQNACGRQVIVQVLAQCRTIEQRLSETDAAEEPLGYS